MKTRQLAFVSISFTAAALMLSERSAYSADTLWDLLRSGSPARPGVPVTAKSPAVSPGAVNLGAPPATPVAGGEGQPRPLVNPNGQIARKRRGGVVGIFDQVGGTFRRLGKTLNSDLKVSGSHTFGWHLENVSGSNEAYQSDIYYGRKGGLGGAYTNTDLTIQGKLFGLFNFETHYNNNPYLSNPAENRFSLNYATKNYKLDAGDITGSIPGNSLIEFSRTLKGIQLSADVMRGVRITSLYSQTKAQTRTIVIPGGNGPGPYYVYVGQIVDGSERVRVNNHEMVKGEDYTLDPYTGELRFKAGTIIGELDAIAVTFETYGYNQSPGLLTGWRADIGALKSVKMGFTYLAQTNSAAGSSRAEKTDQFEGYGGDPNTAYVLDYPVDVTRTTDTAGKTVVTPKYPMKVTVAGVVKVYGTDYILDPLLTNRVYFAYPIPIGQLVRITYTPATTNETPGNRSVMGADASVSLGKAGSLIAEFATSRYDLSGNGINGGAWQLRSDLRFLKDKLHLNWALKNIGSDFTAIESPGFRRNERGLTLGMDYAISPTLKLTSSLERTRRPSYSYNVYSTDTSGLNQSAGLDDYSQLNFGLNWALGKAGQLSLTHNAADTRMYNGGKSSFSTDSLGFTYALKALSFDFSLGRNTNLSRYYYQSSAGGTDTGGSNQSLSAYNTDALTSRLNMRWRASERMTFAAVLANSMIKGTSSGSTNAQDMQFTAEITPLNGMRLSLGYQLQNSGSTSIYGTPFSTTNAVLTRQVPNLGQYTGGFGSGYGSGYGSGLGSGFGSSYGSTLPYYGGGGINGGIGGYGNYSGGFNGGYNGYSFSSFGGKSRAFTVAMNYQPWKNLTLDLNWNSSSSEGDYQFNSRRNDIGLNLTYSLGERLTLNSHFSTQKVSYIGSTGGTNTNMASFTVMGKPYGKLGLTLNYMLMKSNSSFNLASGGTGTTGTNIGGNPFYNGGYGTGGYGTGGYGTGGYYTSGGTNMTGFGLRLEYPVWRGNNAFFQLDNSDSSGTWGGTQRQMSFGMDFNLGNNLVFTLGWRNQESISRSGGTGGGSYSYRVGSLDADLNLHF